MASAATVINAIALIDKGGGSAAFPLKQKQKTQNTKSQYFDVQKGISQQQQQKMVGSYIRFA